MPPAALLVEIAGHGSYNSNFTVSTGSWQHIFWRFFDNNSDTGITDILHRYNNGSEHRLVDDVLMPAMLIGSGTIGNNAAGDSGLDGGFDDLVFYPESFGNSTASSYDYHEAVYQGRYYLGRAYKNISDYIPTLLLRFSETSSNYAREIVNGVTDGGLFVCDTSATCPAVDSSGVYSQGLQFDNSDKLATTTPQAFAVADYTVGFWFKTTATSQQALFSALDESNSNGYAILLELTATGTVRYLHRYPSGNSGGTNLYSTASYNDGVWHYVTAVKQGSDMTLYLDGILVAQATNAHAQGPRRPPTSS